MRTLCVTMSVVAFLALAAAAQETVKSLATQPAFRKAVLTGEDGNPVQGVRLSRAEVKAVVHGNLAQATMTLTFANDQPRVLGGNLVFPLPERATVTGYGLDINGQMIDGVAVEKERARIVYESEVHKRVDPGLVEHVEGNAYRTRLYPIPANGTRSVKIEYVTEIEEMKDGPALALPLGFGDALDELSIRVEALEAIAAPVVKAGGVSGLTFVKAGRGYSAAASAKKAAGGDELIVAFPEIAERSVAVEKREKLPRTVEELEGRNATALPAAQGFGAFDHYFTATDSPIIPARKTAQLKSVRIGIVWDASLSRLNADHARELHLLESVLNRFGKPSVDLIVLRNEIEVQPTFAAGEEGSAKLLEMIRGLVYDGATNLGGLILPKNVADYQKGATKNTAPDYDLFLLFTDGFGNLGADRPLRAEAPVYVVCDDVRANHALLRAICQESGGAYFNLKRVTDEQVLSAVGDAPFSLVSIECNPQEIAEVYPPIGTEMTGRITLSGKLLVPEAKLILHYGFGKQVVSSQTFTISAAGEGEGSLLPRFWAQQKVAALSLFPQKNADELAQLGRQFNLVTPNTSLLVLETPEQYVQYRVVPPRTRPEVYKQFLAMIETNHAAQAQSREQKLQQVAAMWNARVQWWEKEYKYPADLKVDQIAVGRQSPVRNQLNAADERSPVAADRAWAAQRSATSAGSGGQSQHADGASTGHVHTERPAAPGASPSQEPTVTANAGAPGAVNEELSRARQEHEGIVVQHNPQRPSDPASAQEQAARASDPRDAVINLNSADERVLALVPNPTPATQPALGGFGYGAGRNQNGAAVSIKQWDPNTPYLQAMKVVPSDQAYGVFLAQRKNYAASPAFYFDCADYLLGIGQRQLGIRVLSDVVELELHDARLLRVAAHRLNQIGQRETAIDLFEKILKLRPEEPQSYRDLALALADRADAAIEFAWNAADSALPPQETVDRALSDYVRSLELLDEVVLGNWPRFPEVELPVLMEANDIAARAQRLPGVHDFHNPLDSRLQKNLELDARVVMTWDADQTDIDLWVTEPSGEKCFYAHNRTVIGGLLSHDFTDGYGPEEYCLRKLMPGKYLIQANYFGSHQQELTGPATVQATVITNFGRPNEKRQALTVRLKDAKQVIDLGAITLGGGADAKPEPVELNK